MRHQPLIHATGMAIFLLYVLAQFRHVLKLLTTNLSPYAFYQEELAAIEAQPKENATEFIPRIIHQVFLGFDGHDIPESWKHAQQSCIDLNPDYEHMVR